MKPLQSALCCLHSTPLGLLKLTATPRGLASIDIQGVEKHLQAVSVLLQGDELRQAALALHETRNWLDAYFNRKKLPPLPPFDLAGTAFQRRVWSYLSAIPYGRTVSYGLLARMVGKCGAARAVGGAVHRNPLPIIVPCHRVVGANTIGGYAWGITTKRFLLHLECPTNIPHTI